MKLIINRLIVAACLVGLVAVSTAQLYAQEITVLLPLIETGDSTATDVAVEREPITKAPLFEMVPVRDCSLPNTIVWGKVKEDPEPRYEIYVRNSDGSGTRWDGFATEARYTFRGSMPEQVQIARKDGDVVSGWTDWYTIKECILVGDDDNSNAGASNGSINNLTNVVM